MHESIFRKAFDLGEDSPAWMEPQHQEQELVRYLKMPPLRYETSSQEEEVCCSPKPFSMHQIERNFVVVACFQGTVTNNAHSFLLHSESRFCEAFA